MFRSALPAGWKHGPRYSGTQSIEITGLTGELAVTGASADPVPLSEGPIVDVDYDQNALITESHRDLRDLQGG